MKITSTEELGKYIKDKRKKQGYTQKEISDYTGYSASFISQLENGKSSVEFGKALHLANMLGLDLFVEER